MSSIATNVSTETVVVHPLVLLSIVDHFNRIEKTGTKKTRVVGALLGTWRTKGVLDVSSCFAVPFEEDEKDPNVWFLDHDYLNNMYNMCKKVNMREKIVGWYHTGPKLHQNDVDINELVRKYCPDAVLVIVSTNENEIGPPTNAYVAVEELHDNGTPATKTFEHVPSEIGAEESEEVGVEHLLRDVKDGGGGSLSQKVTDHLHGLKGLNAQLRGLHEYFDQVVKGRLPVNHQVVYHMQDILNLLPNISETRFVEAMMVKTNDEMLAIYVASLIRAVLALNGLIGNKYNDTDDFDTISKKQTSVKELSDNRIGTGTN
ncbi:unnamed protein product [Notodromas monacha]|uniref:MPN domain-containing protein n=1 Tax=Notodromas monacha TaxID=399045 RepID=A0A7R9BH26_9CRUS|nr:unnamed protein product [Notodromas monacha]CAG0915345.1 unnamed protein product [Notodromas monacha]